MADASTGTQGAAGASSTSSTSPTGAASGTELATATAAQTGTATPTSGAPGDKLSVQLPGDTPLAKLDALHAKHFAGSKLTTDTESWNLVQAFVADVKKLWSELTTEVSAEVNKL